MNLRILPTLLFIIISDISAGFPPQCLIEIAPLPSIEKKTGRKQPSSFGDPSMLESKGSEQTDYETETFSLLKPQEAQIALAQINMLLLLGDLQSPPVAPVASCRVLQDSAGQKHTFLITRQRLSFNLKTDILNMNMRTKTLAVRARLYSALAQLITKIHQQKIAHCNLKPNSFVSDSIKFTQMKLNKFRYMVFSNKGSCAGNSKSYKPWDVNYQECATPANILKADSYNLALIILMIEDEKNTVSFDTLFKNTDNPIFKCFFRPPNENDCDTTIKNYIKKVIGRKAQKEPSAKPLYRRFASLLYKSFLGCADRATSQEIYNELIEISFNKVDQGAAVREQVLKRNFSVNVEAEDYETETEGATNKVLYHTMAPRPFTDAAIKKLHI